MGIDVEIGDQVRFAKTVGESDVYLFAGITGDFSGNHVNEDYMKRSVYGHRIAHGVLVVGFMSTTSTLMVERALLKSKEMIPVSLGYDRIRFLAPVFIGDTIDVHYTIETKDVARKRTEAKIEAFNQSGTLVAVARHILKWSEAATPCADPACLSRQ